MSFHVPVGTLLTAIAIFAFAGPVSRGAPLEAQEAPAADVRSGWSREIAARFVAGTARTGTATVPGESPKAAVPSRTGRHTERERLLLGPSVQVNARNGAGGGTIVSSKPDKCGSHVTYVVTAFHVVAPAAQGDEKGRDGRSPVEIRVYGPDGSSEERLEGELVAWEEKRDVALLRLRSDRPFPVARLASRAKLADVGVFTPVYAIGCPLGHDPLPSTGEITSLRKVVQGERFWMMSAPTIYGNSGGGVFLRDSGELVGVASMICTLDNPPGAPVPHLSILLPLDSVYDWLASKGLQHVVEPAAPPTRVRTEW